MNKKQYAQLTIKISAEYKRYDELVGTFDDHKIELEELMASNSIIIKYCEEVVDMIQNKPEYAEMTKLYLAQLDHLRASNKGAIEALMLMDSPDISVN